MSEHDQQVAFFKWFRMAHPKIIAFATPNAVKRNLISGKRLKDEGMLAGIPDIMIADGNPGLFIEMKFGKNKTTKLQEQMIDGLKLAGYRVEICYSWIEAKQVSEDYLRIK